jgi:hypothetical protein
MIAVTAIVIFAAGLYAPSEFRVPRGNLETRVFLLLDPVARNLGGNEHRLSGQRSFQSLRRTGACHLCRRSVGFLSVAVP